MFKFNDEKGSSNVPLRQTKQVRKLVAGPVYTSVMSASNYVTDY